MLKIIIMSLIINTMISPFLTHPLSLSIILFIQMINSSLMLLFFLMNSWFSYIMCLVMISGLMVLIIYMTSMASNEKFNLNMKFMIKFIPLIMLIMIILNSETINFLSLYQESMILNQKFNLIISNYMNYPINLLLFIIMLYLFFTMISSVKITEFKKGPLRSFN
uniref:NADH deshydrogenase subunit 6 n=1 Tax=Passalidae sp. GENSP02 TaxID=1205572 RepID=A0A0S2MR23_9SCAR|nr:NADH deshydrogenase subunit 6 [Passalidae sp. GENSP02]